MALRQFSVAMAVYEKDDPAHFGAAIDSIWNQTRRPDEIVLVVDGPIPDALQAEIAARASIPCLRVIYQSENRGLGIARDTALAACAHDLVALMDADDISLPDRFEKQMRRMEEDESLSLVGGYIREFMGDVENAVSIRAVREDDFDIKEDLKKRCPINHMTVLFRKSAVERAGGYQDFYYNEDYYLWMRMCLAGMKFANLPDVLVNVRVGEDMYRRRGGMRYFKSEARLQKLLLENKLIGRFRYIVNLTKRFIVQVLLPHRLRGFVFRRFARQAPQNKKKEVSP